MTGQLKRLIIDLKAFLTRVYITDQLDVGLRLREQLADVLFLNTLASS